MRSFATPLVVPLLLALAACGGGGGDGGGGGGGTTDPTLVGVAPTKVWLDDVATLVITGDRTTWSASAPPTVDLGADVTVDAVVVTSATELRADVRIDAAAATGARFVVVREAVRVLAGPTITVAAPIAVTWISPGFVRGSVLVGAIAARRPGEVVDALRGVEAADGTPIPLYLDDPRGFVLPIPEDVPLGTFDLLVERHGSAGASTMRLPGGTLRPRATVFTASAGDAPRTVTLPTADGTALHRTTATTDAFLEFPMTSGDPTLPIHFLYPHESPFAPPVIGVAPLLRGGGDGGPRTVALAGETFDVVVFAGFATYDLAVVEHPATAVAEAATNDRAQDAQALSLPAIVHPAAIAPDTDEDWYAVAVGASDVGKVLRVVTAGEAPVAVVILRADTATSLGSASAGSPGVGVDLRSSALPAAETVYVRVASGVAPTTARATDRYRLFLRFEAP